MPNPRQFLILSIILIFCSCKKGNKYNYAIKDFNDSLQPYLTKIVERGYVTYSEYGLCNMATDAELEQLGMCEHPILRAAAFREMLVRKSFNHFNIILKHLDDTALVFTDAGEFGLWDRTVSDDILERAEWKTKEEKAKTVDEVLTRHNYLRSAYFILRQLEPQEKYYRFIKEMATRPRKIDPVNGYELDFGDIENALYGLAKFKKREDANVIKKILLDHIWQLNTISFQLMAEFPDTAFFDVLQTYHSREQYLVPRIQNRGFTTYPPDEASHEDFIYALAMQQTDRSAALLEDMLINLPDPISVPVKEAITKEVILAIWEHPCPAYVNLRKKVERKAKEIMAREKIIPMGTVYNTRKDTTKQVYFWNR